MSKVGWEARSQSYAAPPRWAPDESAVQCERCRQPFSLLVRRHHCRNCGFIFCHDCSPKKLPIPKFGIMTPVRVCDRCYDTLLEPQKPRSLSCFAQLCGACGDQEEQQPPSPGPVTPGTPGGNQGLVDWKRQEQSSQDRQLADAQRDYEKKKNERIQYREQLREKYGLSRTVEPMRSPGTSGGD